MNSFHISDQGVVQDFDLEGGEVTRTFYRIKKESHNWYLDANFRRGGDLS